MLYETWASEEAVQAHESGAAFQRYREALRPLVEPDSVVFGNCVPGEGPRLQHRAFVMTEAAPVQDFAAAFRPSEVH